MAVVQVKVDGKVVFEETVDEVVKVAARHFKQLEGVDLERATIDVVPD